MFNVGDLVKVEPWASSHKIVPQIFVILGRAEKGYHALGGAGKTIIYDWQLRVCQKI